MGQCFCCGVVCTLVIHRVDLISVHSRAGSESAVLSIPHSDPNLSHDQLLTEDE